MPDGKRGNDDKKSVKGKHLRSKKIGNKKTGRSKAKMTSFLPSRAIEISGMAPEDTAAGSYLSRTVQLWLSGDDRNLNVEGDIFPRGGLEPVPNGKNVKVTQGNAGTNVDLLEGLYEYHFFFFNGEGSFVLHLRDPSTNQKLSEDGPFTTQRKSMKIYFFEVPTP